MAPFLALLTSAALLAVASAPRSGSRIVIPDRLWPRLEADAGKMITQVGQVGWNQAKHLWRAMASGDPRTAQGQDVPKVRAQSGRAMRMFFPNADLQWAQLAGADLVKANLPNANLLWADLSGADLRGANLKGADLRFANLAGARLHNTNLAGARLNWALLTGADLSGADLRGAVLDGAHLVDARINRATVESLSTVGARIENLRPPSARR